MAHHHPATDLLTAFSAGNIPLSHGLCVSAHIEHCDQCRSNLQRLNSMGAQMFDELQSAPVNDDLKSIVFAMLDEAPVEDDSAKLAGTKAAAKAAGVPRCLQQFIPEDYDSLEWQHVSPSIRAAKLCTDSNGAKVEMLRIKPGGKAALHTHTGDEYTMILKGSFSDESGIYRAGDFVVRGRNDKHRPTATKDEECICLTVTDAPIEFTGFFTRWLNPLIRKTHLPAM